MKRLLFVLLGMVLIFILSSPFHEVQSHVSDPVEIKPDTFELSLLFIGDIMQHMPQIDAAWDKSSGRYDFTHCFHYVKDIYKIADFTIANLEFTFGGKPFRGYPQFSAPDEVGHAMKDAGINVIVTANNHTCDRGRKGIVRTLEVIDSLGIPRTGSFYDEDDRVKHNPLIFEKNGFRIALLNYTYGTNGLPVPAPTMVNLIDTALILKDIRHSKTFNPDEIIVYFHWGDEYARTPNKHQKTLTELCHNNGARIIIGSHPHVLQPMQRYKHPENEDVEVAVAYSLGNYISNQRRQFTDGGAMVFIKLRKVEDIVEISEMAYILTWVWTPTIDGRKKYYIVPVSVYENETGFFDAYSYGQFQRFVKDSREHMKKHNINVGEMLFDSETQSWQTQQEVN